MGKKKGKKGKARDPRLAAKEKNDIIVNASYKGQVAQIQEILEYKLTEQEGHEFIDLNYTNDLGRTALMYATLKGHEEVVEMLSLNKADMNAACKMGNTALHLAAH